MGLFSFLTKGVALQPSTVTLGPVTPFTPQDSLETAVVGELFGVDSRVITRDIAMRVPGLKRAVQVHCDTVATMPLVQYRDGVKVDPQPGWLQNSASGIAPLIRTKPRSTDGEAC